MNSCADEIEPILLRVPEAARQQATRRRVSPPAPIYTSIAIETPSDAAGAGVAIRQIAG
jgi:hypothetical protein